MELRHLDCDCHLPEHSVRFYWWVGDNDPDFQYLGLEVQMAGYLPWYKRILPAINYFLFGGIHCGWSETFIRETQAEELKAIIEDYLGRNPSSTLTDKELRAICKEKPKQMIKWLNSDIRNLATLSRLAEIAGSEMEGGKVIKALIYLAKNKSSVVREGAVLGLSHHISDKRVKALLESMAEKDKSAGVRETAKEVLDDD